MRRCVLATLLIVAAGTHGLSAQEAVWDPPALPGDVVRLEVWGEEDLTGDFLIDQRHLVTLPLIGEVDVRGQTESSLRAMVREGLSVEVVNPSVQLFVLKRVRVLGEVMEPGLYELDATMTVADALAMAGGRTPLAVDGNVVLRRDGTTSVTDIRASTSLSSVAVQTGDELLVMRRGWFDRNLLPTLSATAGLLALLITISR